MSSPSNDGEFDWERARSYLRVLVDAGIDPRLRGKIDPSDLVQQSLVQAVGAQESFRGTTEAERLAWLKQILVNNVFQAVRHHTRQKRDVNRERSIRAAIEESAMRGESLLLSKEAAPDEMALRGERTLELYAALEELGAEQRTAIELHYWQGLPVSEVAARMEKTIAAVGGLLKRGLKLLRESVSRE